MDYRDKNPIISIWQGRSIVESVRPFPFNFPQYETFKQYLAPDDQTVFLGLHGGVAETEDGGLRSYHYLIESPVDCKLRAAFAVGKITWEDFWYNKGWFIELISESVFDDFAKVSFVRSENISDSAKKKIQKYNHTSPLQLKYQALCRCTIPLDPAVDDKRKQEKDLQEFVQKYYSYLNLDAA